MTNQPLPSYNPCGTPQADLVGVNCVEKYNEKSICSLHRRIGRLRIFLGLFYRYGERLSHIVGTLLAVSILVYQNDMQRDQQAQQHLE